MATKPKRIEDMSEAELIEGSTKAYDKARTSPEPGGFDVKSKWGGKTAIGDAAAKASFDKNWAKNESKDATMNRVTKARDEADNEVKRETRGMAPRHSLTRPRAPGLGWWVRWLRAPNENTERAGPPFEAVRAGR